MGKKLTTEEFIERAKKVHGDKYDYSKVEYVNNSTKVCIICPKHGEFWQIPSAHMEGHGCSKCQNERLGDKQRLTTEEFIQKAKKVHGDKFDYSKVEYVNNSTKVCIICPKHGEFWQRPANHLNGQGCQKCKTEKTIKRCMYTQEEFLEKANRVHNFLYDYSKTVYNGAYNKVDIICKKHGMFKQTPGAHLAGQGCPMCAKEHLFNSRKLNTETFIQKAREIHGDKYDYSKVEYVNYDTHVCIICPEHGEFWQSPDSHLQGKGCPKCSNVLSRKEDEITEYIKSKYNGSIIRRNRKIIYPYELDIYIPDLKIGIEYNGLFWHSDYFGGEKPKERHIKKLNLCKEKGVKLIQIFEDEYILHKDIVLSKIEHLLKFSDKPKVYGRKCSVKEIDFKESKDFLSKNHIQSYTRSTVYLGCYYNSLLIGVMSFKRERKNNNKWELDRFATDINYNCSGVGGKLFKYFIRKYNPDEIKSFADRRWTINEDNNIYLQLGFKFDYYTKPDYRYYKRNGGYSRIHKFNCRKQILHKKYGLPLSMTEDEMVKKLDYYKIYDCGLIKYIWKNESKL